MTATRITTVSRVKVRSCFRVLGPGLLALATGEAAVRLLSPRASATAPAPVDPRDHFSALEIERGRRFARPQLALALARVALQLGTLGAVVRRRSRRPSIPSAHPIAGGAVSGAGLAIELLLPGLPPAAMMRRRAIAAGLITQSWRGWGADLVKASAIEAALAAGGGAAVVAASRRWPHGWWAPAAGGAVLFTAALSTLAPVLLDPVFNDFEPLGEGDTRARLLALARTAGVRVGEVYSVDASRRTTAANAYVSGLGPTKRVVLFDTLLDRYGREEVQAVVAHELAHVAHRDVLRSIAFTAIVAPAAALTAQRLSWALSAERGTPGALPALALATGIVLTVVGLLASRLSRAVERRADAFALELSGAAEAFVSFERAIALQNFADLDPPRWVSSLLATHPPTAERIGMALSHIDQASAARP